jgi:FkbM family methyltransferase
LKFDLLYLRFQKVFAVLRSLPMTRGLIRFGVLAAVEHAFVLKRPYSLVVDVGANKGQFALAVRGFQPQARVLSFEPLSGPLGKLHALFSNDDLIETHQCCLGSSNGELDFNVSKRDDSSSLLKMSERQVVNYPGTDLARTQKVQVRRLDEVLSAPLLKGGALLKIDVQGFELEVLKGCGDLLHGFSAVYCECSFVSLYAQQAIASEVIEFLATKGFSISGLYNCAYDQNGQCIQADILFEPDQRPRGGTH